MKNWIYVGILLSLFSCESKEKRLEQFLLKGNLAAKSLNSDQALYYFEQATKLDPCFVEAWNNMGTVHYRAGRYTEALIHYEKAIACDSVFLGALINRANTLYELRELYSALSDIERIKRLKSDTAVVFFVEGLIKTRMRDFPGGLEAFSQAIKRDSANAELWVNRATVWYYQRAFEDARVDLKKAEQINPAEPNIYNTLALIEAEGQNFSEAIRLVNRALLLKPDDPYFINNRGYFYLQLGETEKALTDIDHAIISDPTNGWAYRNKGLYFLAKNQYSDAERLLVQAYSRDEFIDKIDYHLGVVYFNTGKIKQACLAFTRAQAIGITVEKEYLDKCDQ
jgi:tetratricopeptide (TPR) repeat protein